MWYQVYNVAEETRLSDGDMGQLVDRCMHYADARRGLLGQQLSPSQQLASDRNNRLRC